MEPYKMEQDIKNKLEKRTIQPSINSWERLSGSLNQKEHKKNNKFLWIMGVAASIVGILFFVSIFIKEDTEKNTPVIVTSPELKKEETTIKIASEELKEENSGLEKIVENERDSRKLESLSEKPNYKSVKQKEKVIVSDQLAMKKKEIVNKQMDPRTVVVVSSEEQQMDSIILKIQNLKIETKGISVSDIDALLLNAQQELALQKIVDESVKTVDAYKLLQDVEADLDKSIRVKFLETLKLNYENMKTVIAQRND